LSSKKIDLYRDFAAGFYLSECQNPIPPPLILHTEHVNVDTVYLFTKRRRKGGDQRWERGSSSQSRVKKYQHD
jgi:hypothetical protein